MKTISRQVNSLLRRDVQAGSLDPPDGSAKALLSAIV